MIYWLCLLGGVYFFPLILVLLLKRLPEFKYLFYDNKKIFQTSWILGISAVLILSFLVFLGKALDNDQANNFFLHLVGGGVVSSMIFEYIKLNLKIKLSFALQVIMLFMIVSSLGCLNELFEFLLSSNTNMEFSYSSTDTWKDILANTIGAYTGFILWRVLDLVALQFNLRKI